MDIILLQRVKNLGQLGDRVSVKSGYGRNYLIPQGFAVSATATNVAAFEARRAELERLEAEKLAAAEARKAALEGVVITLSGKAGDEGKLFGSIGPRDIADALQSRGVQVDKSEIRMHHGALRHIGEFSVDLIFHHDVTAELAVNIIPEA